jgi:hypothetical protein
MNGLVWFVEPNKDARRREARGSSDPALVQAVLEKVCSAAALDGFTDIGIHQIVTETGLRPVLVERAIADLVAGDLLRIRRDGRNARLLEPGPSIRLVYRLVA